jgi:uncharacterized phage protein gp47/JayE
MPFPRPTLAECVSQAIGDLDANLAGVDSRLYHGILYPLAIVLATARWMNHEHIQIEATNLLPGPNCPDPSAWARITNTPRREASYATGTVFFIGEEEATIPAGTRVQRADGVQYATDEEATVEDGVAYSRVTCQTPGANGNCGAGTPLTLVTPVEGIETNCSNAGVEISGGLDQETAAEWNERILDTLADPPQGGCGADYRRWAREVAGVDAAWTYPAELGRGTVTVRFTGTADATSVYEYLLSHDDPRSGRTVGRPVTADLYVYKPTEDATAVEIDAPGATAAQKAAVEAELADLFASAAVPGGDVEQDDGTTAAAPPIYLGQLHGAISRVLTNYTLVSPAADVSVATGYVAVLGTVTWS